MSSGPGRRPAEHRYMPHDEVGGQRIRQEKARRLAAVLRSHGARRPEALVLPPAGIAAVADLAEVVYPTELVWIAACELLDG